MTSLKDDDIVSTSGNTREFFFELYGLTTRIKIIDYLREVVRIMDQGGKAVPFKLTRANLAVNFCMALNLNVFEEIPRLKANRVI